MVQVAHSRLGGCVLCAVAHARGEFTERRARARRRRKFWHVSNRPGSGTATPPAVSYELVVCIAKDLREPSPQTPRTTKEAPPTNSFMNVTHTHVHTSHALDHRHSQHDHR